MKNYLESLKEFIRSKNIFVPGLILFGINVAIFAGFLVVYMLFSWLQKLILSGLSYPLLPALVVLFFIFLCVKVWYDFGILLKNRFTKSEKPKKKISESLVIDIIGLLPFLLLLILNNLITSLKVIANPGAVTGELMTNTIIATGALVVQMLIVEFAVLKKGKMRVGQVQESEPEKPDQEEGKNNSES